MWNKFSKLNREKLFLVKNQLHAAIQLAAIPPRSYLPTAENDSSAALKYDSNKKAFISQYFGHLKNIQMAFNMPRFSLDLIVEEIVFDSIGLESRSFQFLTEWTKDRLRSLQLDVSEFSHELPYKLETIDVTPDLKFINYGEQILKDFASYYHNSNFIFRKFQHEILKKKSTISVWPHHFDIAMILEPSPKNFVGIGLSPGDQYYPEPYYYVSFPTRTEEDTKSIRPIVGQWHTNTWNGLVLLAREFILETEHLEERIIIDYLKNAYDISQKVLH